MIHREVDTPPLLIGVLKWYHRIKRIGHHRARGDSRDAKGQVGHFIRRCAGGDRCHDIKRGTFTDFGATDRVPIHHRSVKRRLVTVGLDRFCKHTPQRASQRQGL